jgi:anaerobic selenocysteine-containing dehydrogenase
VKYINEKIKQLLYRKKLGRMGVVLNAWLTNEELFLANKIFAQDLKLKKVFFPEPAQGEKDDLLLTEDRTPNKKGAEEIGFQFDQVNQEELFEDTELLMVFWASPFDLGTITEMTPEIKKVKTKILFTPFKRKWNDDFDMVIPTAVSAEKGGSFTNTDGKVQHFGPVLSPLGEAQAEWKWLVSLGKEIGVDFKSYIGMRSPLDVFKIMKDEIKFFRK